MTQIQSEIQDRTSVPLMDFQDRIQEHVEAVSTQGVEQLTQVMGAMALLSRAGSLSDAEVDERLGKMLPPNLVDLLKEQKKLLPEDPYLVKLQELNDKVGALQKEIATLKSEKGSSKGGK